METNIYCKPEEEIIDFLKSNQIEYTQIKHTALFTMDEYENIQKKLNCLIPKNLFLCNRQKTKFYLLLMPGNKKFLTKELSSQINSARLSFAEEEKLKETLNCYKGSTSPLGLLFDKKEEVTLLIDKDLWNEEFFGFHPCDNTSTLKIKKEDFILYLNIIRKPYTFVTLKGE